MIGFHPEAEKTLTRIESQIIDGKFLMPTSKLEANKLDTASPFYQDPDPMNYPEFDGEVIVGKDLAKDLDLSIGSKLILFGMNAEGETAEGIFKIAGIYKSGLSKRPGSHDPSWIATNPHGSRRSSP